MDDTVSTAPSRFFVSLLVALVGSIIYMLAKAYKARKIINDLRKQGLAMPKFNWITGHMLAIKPFVDKLPPDAITNYIMTTMAFAMKKNAFYLDFWPISAPILVVTSPMLASQLTQEFNPLKPSNLENAFAGLCGGPNLFTMPDVPWKRWRSIFSPGFSPTYMLEQTPKIVDQCRIFCDRMRQYAHEGEMFSLEEYTLRLTLDVIGLISMDTHFNYQHADSDLPKSLRRLIEWVSFGTEMNPFNRWTPKRPLMVAYYGRRVDNFITKELKNRFARRKDLLDTVQDPKGRSRSVRAKSVVDLALDAYSVEEKSNALDATFLQYACSQIRLFLFAGHDTTSSAMVYTYHLLALNPNCLARLRAEHNTILGPDPAKAGDCLSDQPTLLNQLPYTTACIKEALRLFPPASAMRIGGPNTVLVDEDGTRYPTKDCNVWALHLALQRNPEFWPSANEFIPERWLVGPGDPLHPVKGAWRPFEFGPRNCIGQTLAMAEIKILLAMTIRTFDFSDAYDEWDQLHPSKHPRTALGDRAYQVEGGGGGSHAANGYPCRVGLASNSETVKQA